ncbi:FUSC family protein [Mycolicibacterium pulveris]|uniref:FUSC family protein n=1 Tax=Mycolicibacterium pulveris TaxID=36813 RepID=UPI003CF77326
MRTPATLSGFVGRARRAMAQRNLDRDNVLLLGKSVLAGTVAWLLAAEVFNASHATFAPFSAVLLMQITIADSVQMAIRYTAAVVVGVCLTGAIVLAWDVHPWLFPVILLIALVIGRWRRLGSQGINVTVAAIFAYGAFAMPDPGISPASQLPEIAGMVVLGASVALTVNLLVAPPLRYRSAGYAVESFSDSLSDLLTDIVDGLESGPLDADVARHWRGRADDVARIGPQVRDTVDHADQTSRFNPRRLLVHDHRSFDGYRVTIQAADRITAQLRSVTTGLLRVAERDADEQQPRHGVFLRDYATVLAAVRDAVAAMGAIHSVDDLVDGDRVADAVQTCRAAVQVLGSQAQGEPLDQPTQWSVYGGLYADAHRLCDEVGWACDGLDEVADAVRRQGRSARRSTT